MNSKEFISKLIKYCIPSIVSALVGLLAIPIISGMYPAEDYGKINLFYSVGNMILYIALLGLDSAYIRFYFEPPKGTEKKQLFSLALFASVISIVLFTTVAYFIFPDIVSQYMFGESNRILIVLFGLYIIGLILFRLLSIESRMDDRAILFNMQQILLIFTNRVSFVIVAFKTTDYKVSIEAITFSSIILGLIFLLYQKKLNIVSRRRINAKTLKTIFTFAIPLMPTAVMTWLNNSAVKMVLSGYGAFELVGVLSIATSLANVFSIIPSAFNTYWSPFMYSNYKNQQTFIRKVHSYIMILSIVITLCIFCFQDVLYIFVKGDYKVSQAYFMLIMLTPIQSLVCETTCYGIYLSNKTIYNLYIAIASGGFNILASWLLYRPLGIWGVVIGISGSAILQLVLKTFIGQKYYRSVENIRKTCISVIIVILICFLNVFVYPSLVIRIFVSLFTLMLTILLYKNEFMNSAKSIRIIFDKIRAKIKKKDV